MVRRAAQFLVMNGPVTPMDRWEEEAGYFASTMPVEIAALLIAAGLAEARDEPHTGTLSRPPMPGTTRLTSSCMSAGHNWPSGRRRRLLRPFCTAQSIRGVRTSAGFVNLKNHRDGRGRIRVAELISPDALCLVRFGLRAADDPRIVNTVRVIDHLLQTEMPHGPCWHRYNCDGYGEHADGSPYNGTGIGRAWPLLTGERAHYELIAGRKDEAEPLLAAIESFASESGLLPEQIWDAADIAETRPLFWTGNRLGHAASLAHAEYVKLRRSLHDGRVFDRPQQTVDRYLKRQTASSIVFWRFTQQRRNRCQRGSCCASRSSAPAKIRWTSDGWRNVQENETRDTGLGIHIADLNTEKLGPGTKIDFTFFGARPAAGRSRFSCRSSGRAAAS